MIQTWHTPDWGLLSCVKSLVDTTTTPHGRITLGPIQIADFGPSEDIITTIDYGGKVCAYEEMVLADPNTPERSGSVCDAWSDEVGVQPILQYSPDGRYLAVIGRRGQRNGMLGFVWDASAKRRVLDLSAAIQQEDHQSLSESVSEIPTSVVFSPDSRYMVTLGVNQNVPVWDLHAPGVSVYLSGPTKPPRCAVFSPDGQFIISGGDDHAWRVWHARTGRCVQVVYGLDRCDALVLSYMHESSKAFIIAANFRLHTIRVWEVAFSNRLGLARKPLLRHVIGMSRRLDLNGQFEMCHVHDRV